MDNQEDKKIVLVNATRIYGALEKLVDLGMDKNLILKEIQKGHDDRWSKQVGWHKWGTIFSLISFLLGSVNVLLVACGLYFYPEETRALFDTFLTLFTTG